MSLDLVQGDVVVIIGRSGSGMVFQHFNLSPHLSVERNVSLPSQEVIGCGAREAADRARAALKRLGVLDKAGLASEPVVGRPASAGGDCASARAAVALDDVR